MSSVPLSRCCIHTITTRPLSLAAAVEIYRDAGFAGITVWRDALATAGIKESVRILALSGLKVVSLCRGGFFPATDEVDRRHALDDNRRAIDEAAAIGAPLVVLVCGAVPGMPLREARKQIEASIAALIPHARQAGVKLAIEPLHPMYADTRSAVVTVSQANDMVERLASPQVGVTIDVYHTWWDDRLESEIARSGRLGAIFSFHVCDWRTPLRDILNDRGLMGEGCIPVRQIRSWVERAGFDGMIEMEIFSNQYWQENQREFVSRIRSAFIEHV
jgi:sugar phosphate isomerase/epimerase